MNDQPPSPRRNVEVGESLDGADASSDVSFDPMDDPMAPPRDPCECWCLHCQRTFMSNEMWFQRVINARDGFPGFWMCPTPNCDGAGFTIDIFPTDPNHPANDGWHEGDEDEEDFEDNEDDEDDDAGEWVEEHVDVPADEWDPAETKYRELDEEFEEYGDEDIEGEEWKYGLSPGERPAEPEWAEDARRRWEEEQKRYDQPDERPRVLDWKDREPPVGGDFSEDDIPF